MEYIPQIGDIVSVVGRSTTARVLEVNRTDHTAIVIVDIVSVVGRSTTARVLEVDRMGQTAILKAPEGVHRMTINLWNALTLITRPA